MTGRPPGSGSRRALLRVDLHVHTTASDGDWSPAKVVRAAAAGGLDVIAVTDHDTTSGWPEAARAAANASLELVSGIEISTTLEGTDLHVLGYGVRPDAAALQEYARAAWSRRRERMAEIVERLAKQGVHVPLDSVLARAGGGDAVVSRPHLAAELVERGHAQSIGHAFDRWIGDGHPAYVPMSLAGPDEGIAVIRAAGGLPVWAHPRPEDLEDRMGPLVDAGLAGLEVHRPGTDRGLLGRMEKLAASHGIWVTGGSDWHGPNRNAPLGSFAVSGAVLEDFFDALARST